MVPKIAASILENNSYDAPDYGIDPQLFQRVGPHHRYLSTGGNSIKVWEVLVPSPYFPWPSNKLENEDVQDYVRTLRYDSRTRRLVLTLFSASGRKSRFPAYEQDGIGVYETPVI